MKKVKCYCTATWITAVGRLVQPISALERSNLIWAHHNVKVLPPHQLPHECPSSAPSPGLRPFSEERRCGCSSLCTLGQLWGQGHSHPSCWRASNEPLMSLCVWPVSAVQWRQQALPLVPSSLWPDPAPPSAWRTHHDLPTSPADHWQRSSVASFHHHMQQPDVFHTLWISQLCTTLDTSSLVFSLPSVNWGMMCYRF